MPIPPKESTLDLLLEEPYRFEFFQAVRLLERWFVEHGDVRPRDAVPHKIGFRTTVSTAFPASEIEQIMAYADGDEKLPAKEARSADLDATQVSRVELTPAFFGLLGNQGALPIRYTEDIVAREQLFKDKSARGFLDIFSNRATALFYGAWKKYRLPFQYELDHDERYLPLLQAFAGLANKSTQASMHEGSGKLMEDAVAGHAAAAWHRPVSMSYLRQSLADYFDVPVRVEQFVGKWYDVPPEQQSRLNRNNVVLGSTALLGKRVWQRSLGVRIVLGPLSKTEYDAFLDGNEWSAALHRLLRLLIGTTLEYEVELILSRSDVRSIQLDGHGRLGMDAFLSTRPSDRDRSDLQYILRSAISPTLLATPVSGVT